MCVCLQPRLNDDCLLDIFAYMDILDLTQLAQCSLNFHSLAVRTFRTQFKGKISLDTELLGCEATYRDIFAAFGSHTDRIEIVSSIRSRDHRTEHRNSRLFHWLWRYVNAKTIKSLKVHPFELQADRMNFFGSHSINILPQLTELDLAIPLASANLNCDVPFNVWCPQLQVFRVTGHFGMDIPCQYMPTRLHTIEIKHNLLIEQEQIRQLIKANRHTLQHLVLVGLNEIEDTNRFLDILIACGVHRTLKTLVLQLRREWCNTQWPHSLYTLRTNLLQFGALNVLDIAGFGNIANLTNARLFAGLQTLEVLVISSPLFNLSVEADEDFLAVFPQHLPPRLKEIWLKRLMVKPTVWKRFRQSMPATCSCHHIPID